METLNSIVLYFMGFMSAMIFLTILAVIIRLLTYWPVRCPNCLNLAGFEIKNNNMKCRACGLNQKIEK